MRESNDEDKFVRNQAAKDSRAAYDLSHAFHCAGEGIVYAFASQRNFKIQCAGAICAVILGCTLRITTSQWTAIVLCIGSVLAAECANTAIESTIDLVSPEWNELAKHAKDAAAGAVLLLSIMSVVVGLVVFVPALLRIW